MADLVEVLAMAIGQNFLWGTEIPDTATCGEFADRSRRAVQSALTALESAGYRVVPVEPTEAMVEKAADPGGWNHRVGKDTVRWIYSDMLAAAPTFSPKAPD